MWLIAERVRQTNRILVRVPLLAKICLLGHAMKCHAMLNVAKKVSSMFVRLDLVAAINIVLSKLHSQVGLLPSHWQLDSSSI